MREQLSGRADGCFLFAAETTGAARLKIPRKCLALDDKPGGRIVLLFLFAVETRRK